MDANIAARAPVARPARHTRANYWRVNNTQRFKIVEMRKLQFCTFRNVSYVDANLTVKITLY